MESNTVILKQNYLILKKESYKYLNPYNYGSRYQYPIDTWH